MAAVAQSRIQDDVHPLLRHPRPIKRDTAKAQRMLGLVADSEERLKGLQREKSVTTRWLERPMYEHLEASDVDSDREEVAPKRLEEKTYEAELAKVISNSKISVQTPSEKGSIENDADLLDKWTNPERPTSINPAVAQVLTQSNIELESSMVKRRPDPLLLPRPVSYNAKQMLSPEWTTSPATMSPRNLGQRPVSSYLASPSVARSSFSSTDSVCECNTTAPNSKTWPTLSAESKDNARLQRPISYHTENSMSFGSPPQRRPRPMSYATYHQRNRSGSKIASSRGLRNNSYPNYSRPMSAHAPKAVPGEHMENDSIFTEAIEREVEPLSPVSPLEEAIPVPNNYPIHDVLAAFELREDKEKTDKKSKNRWSSIPNLVKKVAARRQSSATSQPPSFEVREVQQANAPRAPLSEERYRDHEKSDASHYSSTIGSHLSAVEPIMTPTYSPSDVRHQQFPQQSPKVSSTNLNPLPMPFAPWADGPPSPAISVDRSRRSSGSSSLSPTRKAISSRLSAEAVPRVRPSSMYSQRSSIILNSPHSTTYPTFEISQSPRTGSRRGTPVPDPTCIMCKTCKPSYEFLEDRITPNCWHESATCVQCLQAWVHHCVNTRGWDGCTCPECGEVMSRGDVTNFVGAAVHVG